MARVNQGAAEHVNERTEMWASERAQAATPGDAARCAAV